MFHATSQTFNVATHLTSDHHILNLTSHYTAVCRPPPFHTTTSQPQPTSLTIPHTQLFHTTPTFNISTFHTIPHRITPPHLTSQHIASFSTSDITPHLHYATFHTTPYSTSHILHFNHTMSEMIPP